MEKQKPSDECTSTETLSALFDHGFKIHGEIMDSSDDWRGDAFQNKVRKCILALEDATRLVSLADVFSRNENVKEVPTEHVKYFLLPALLSEANSKLFDEAGDREEAIAVQEAYLRDFLRRCNDYEITEVEVPKEADGEEGAAGAPPSMPPGRPSPADLARMNKEREAKIRRFREQKELEERISELRAAVLGAPERADDEAVREFYLKTIMHFANRALDDLASLAMEKPLVKHMKKMRAGGGNQIAPAKPEKRRPLKPIVITRDAIQKEVFGMGYKNLPVMSIEEFYDQRVRDGWFPDPSKQPKSLQDMTVTDQKAAEEEEAREKEEKEERDDEEELERKRNWDEYKDDHRRGEGNMHNKG